MFNIPSDCLSVIFSRLPAEELLEFRRVSKAWCRIIDDPTFIQLHLHYHQTNDSGQHLLIRNESGNDLYSRSLLDFFDFSERHRQNTVWSRPVNKTLTQHGLSNLHVLPVPSCNGLILTHDDEKMISVLWNPLRGEFRELPPCVDCVISNPLVPALASGLGYDSAADDFKVVKIFSTMVTSVYSLKSNSWRRIADFPGRVHVGKHFPCNGCFSNGALHWIINTQGSRGEPGIIALDLGTENYRVISPLPLVFRNLSSSPWPWINLRLNVLDGCLFLCGSTHTYPVGWIMVGWIMHEYGEVDSWTKVFSFKGKTLLKPIAYLRSKQLILFNGSNEFFWLNVKDRKSKIVKIRPARDNSTIQVFTGSLVRLNTNDCDGVGNDVVEGIEGKKSTRIDDRSSAAKGTACRKRKRDDSWLRLVLKHYDTENEIDV